MIHLTFTVDNINTVISVYNQIQIQRSDSDVGVFSTISGLGPITLVNGQSLYYVDDLTGVSTDWYKSRYYSSTSGYYSAWSDSVLGESGDIFYNPLYPEEISYGTAQKLIIDRIRRLIGDPVGIRREYGEDASSSIHSDGRTYELDEKGWPAVVNMNNTQYTSTYNPSVNGYRFLRFSDRIDTTTWSGCTEYGVDIWYYTFRHSDREIMESYDSCPPPPGLTTTTSTSEAYMLQTAIDLITQELWEDSSEDGAKIADEGSIYDPSIGLSTRKGLLDKLQKRLDTLVKALMLTRIEGVRID